MRRTLVPGICLSLCLGGFARSEDARPAAENRTPGASANVAALTHSIGDRNAGVVRTVAAEGARGNRPSAFSYPSGLSKSAECLFQCLGQCPPNCVPMTSDTTYDLAYACFIRGLYEDAIIFANRGLTIRDDARLYLIRGVCELHVGRCTDAEVTAEQYLTAIGNRNLVGIAIARERVNGPMRVRFEQVLKHIAPGPVVTIR